MIGTTRKNPTKTNPKSAAAMLLPGKPCPVVHECGESIRHARLLTRIVTRQPLECDDAGTMTEIPELTSADFERAIPASVRRRLMAGQVEPGDIAALRRFLGLTQTRLANAMGISVHGLRNWEQGRRHPNRRSIAFLRFVARHPDIIRANQPAIAEPGFHLSEERQEELRAALREADGGEGIDGFELLNQLPQ
jgi:putative transcriptional regulator